MTVVEFESAGKLAEKVLEVLDQRGWIREEVEDSEGKVCLIGAVGLAHGATSWGGYDLCDENPSPIVSSLICGVEEYVVRNYEDFITSGPNSVTLYRFNDTYASDVTAVELALEYVINQERQQQAEAASA